MKQRVVGIIVWAVLAALFLPMLLDGNGMPISSNPTHLIRPVSGDRITLVLTPDSENNISTVSSVKSVPAQVRQPVPAPAELNVKQQSPEAASSSELPAATGWVVQVGSFNRHLNAKRLRDQLMGRGYQSFVEMIKNTQRHIFRVYVGPVADREAARRLRIKLQNQEQQEGLVMRYPS